MATPDDDLVLDEEEDFEQPMFQKAQHEGDGAAMVAKEADKETAGESKGLEAAGNNSASSVSAGDDGGRPVAKVVIVGDSGVGKTALMTRFAKDTFQEATRATIGLDMHTTELSLPGGGTIRIQLWDTAGQETFNALTTSYFRQAHAVLMLYDCHSPTSFASLSRWMGEVDRHAPAEVCKCIVGSKCDDGPGAATPVSEADAEAFATKHGALNGRCSAKTDSNVRAVFEQIAQRIIRHGFNPEGRRSSKAVGLKLGAAAPAQKKKGCC